MKTHLFILLGIVSITSAAQADNIKQFEVEYEAKLRAQEQAYTADNNEFFEYKLAGNQDKGGAVQFFVKDTMMNGINDPTAGSLNNIAPAAGVQLSFDFSL